MSRKTTKAEKRPNIDERARAVFQKRNLRRGIKISAGVLIWGWIILRWMNDWLNGLFVPAGTPFISPNTFSNISEVLSDFAASYQVISWPLNQLAGFFDSVAFAIPYLPELAEGIWITILLTIFVIILGFVFAVPLTVARIYGGYTKYISFTYTEIIRGTPMLAQLFLLYYGFPQLIQLFQEIPLINSGFSPAPVFWVAVVGFTINDAAYQSEYMRGAFESVDHGQFMAGQAIGLSKISTIYRIILPQGLRRAIPSWTNDLVYLIKYTSFASFITVPELFYRIESITSTTFNYVVMYALAALFYLTIIITASSLMSTIENRYAIPGTEQNRRR